MFSASVTTCHGAGSSLCTLHLSLCTVSSSLVSARGNIRTHTPSSGPDHFFPQNVPFALQPPVAYLESRPLEDDRFSRVWNASDLVHRTTFGLASFTETPTAVT